MELDKSLWPEDSPEQGEAVGGAASSGDVGMEEDDDEAPMPEPFEYPFED